MICVVVRTRDEERHIVKFCEAYQNADLILVADGGSLDNTKKIAKTFPNVIVRDFTERVNLNNGYWRNNDSDHTNFLISWAKEYNPDWIISDDCDIRPNYLLKREYVRILNDPVRFSFDVLLAVRVYLWGNDKYFPLLSSPLGEENGQGSLWAWRGDLDLWTVNEFPHFSFRLGASRVKDFRTDTNALELLFPYCLLHYNWNTPEMVDDKLRFHHESGITPGMRHPLDFGGSLQELKEWMHE